MFLIGPFNFVGANQGLWFVDLKNGNGNAGKGKIDGADSTLTMDGKDFFDMFSGNSTNNYKIFNH